MPFTDSEAQKIVACWHDARNEDLVTLGGRRDEGPTLRMYGFEHGETEEIPSFLNTFMLEAEARPNSSFLFKRANVNGTQYGRIVNFKINDTEYVCMFAVALPDKLASWRSTVLKVGPYQEYLEAESEAAYAASYHAQVCSQNYDREAEAKLLSYNEAIEAMNMKHALSRIGAL